MKFWIKKCARIFGAIVFFLILFYNLIEMNSFESTVIVIAIIKAFLCGVIFWFVGFIISDILLKGIITDIDTNNKENLLEGGFVQRMHMEKEKLHPGGAELPFVEEKIVIRKKNKDKKNT
jgi:hypothetical protein